MPRSPYRLHTSAGMLLALVMAGGCGPGVLEPVEMRISVVEGNRQVDSVLAVLPIPLRVQVQDPRNQPMPGVEVRWSAHVAGGSLSDATSLTDAQGIAVVTYALGSRTGPYYVSARPAGISGQSAWFEVRADPGAPARIQGGFGGEVFGLPGTALAHYGVYITDDYFNPVSGVTVDWLVTEGGGFVHPVQSTSAYEHPATTRHTLGPQDGPQTVLAVASGLPGAPQVAFTATAVGAIVSLTGDDYWDCYMQGACNATEFVPAVVTINTGQSVAWTWSNPLLCDVVFEDDPTAPLSAPARSTGTHLRTFTDPGFYRYRCTRYSSGFHNGMVGAVMVQ